MKIINARYLLNFSTEQLFDMLIGDFKLKFDDGVIIDTNYRQTLFSSYFWNFHRTYHLTPLLSIHHVRHVLKGKDLTSKTHIDLLGIIFNDVVETYKFTDPLVRDQAVKLIYEITNFIYNDLIIRTEAFVVSLDIIDFIEVMDHPDIKSTLDKVTVSNVAGTYKNIMHTLRTSPDLQGNAIVKASKAKLVNNAQLLQCIGPRGALTDIDSMIFDRPILRGYARGLISLYDSMIESRSAAKSLFFSEDPLKESEYFARRLQLLCMTVENLHHTDCGSTDYLVWNVKPPIYNDITREMEYSGDLPYILGKWYIDEETNSLKYVKITDTHLYGKTIKMRSVIAGCHHKDPHGVCSVCFGKMSDNVPPDSNLGHNCSATMNRQASQGILSIKHYDGNALIDYIILSVFEKKFLTTGTDGNSYYLNPILLSRSPKLYINCSEAFGLNDINLVKDVKEINISRISRIEYIGLEQTFDVKGHKNVDMSALKVGFNGRLAMLSHEFLAFAKINKWALDGKYNFVFDLSNWDFSLPIMRLPNKQYNMSDHSANLADIIEARVEDIQERSKVESPSATLVELFDAVNSKLTVNLSLLEVILYASMIISAEDDNYKLPKPWDRQKTLGVASMTIPRRSLGACYPYEDLFNTVTKPMSFFKLWRQDSLMDVFLTPKEVVEYSKNKEKY